jgi:phospholipid/cholesterol/gamma-HCH transport system substrate-binding protein
MKFFKKDRGSFLERNQLIIGILASLFVLGGSTFALLLSGGVFARTYTVKASFSDAAGIKSGDNVTVAGLETGKVSGVEIKGNEVIVTLDVNHDVEMPSDSRAEIVIETLLGRKSVALVAGTGDEMLEDGDVIDIENTRTPVDIIELADTSVRLLEESDAEAFETFMQEITEITQGKEKQVSTLIEGLGDVTAAVDSRRDELARLIGSLQTLSQTFAERDDTLVSLIDNYDVVLSDLATRTDDLQELLESTDSASFEVASLVGRNRSTIDSALAGLRTTLKVVDRHQAELAAAIPYLEDAVRGYSSVGYSQGVPNRWANIFVQSLGPVGIDAIAGPCGALDQALDQLLGPDPRDCDERAEFGEEEPEDGPLSGAADQKNDDDAEVTDPIETIQELIPGDLGDILDSVTGATGLGAALRGGLLP